MYAVTVTKRFKAAHFLIAGNAGPERRRHEHRYKVSVRLEGRRLDGKGYLIDIVDVKRTINALVSRYRSATLNALPEFRGSNPSLELFARVFCDRFVRGLDVPRVRSVTVMMAEGADASASYRYGGGMAREDRPGNLR